MNVGMGLATGLGVVLISGLILVMHGGRDTASAAATPADAGATVFATSGCTGCHTLAKAGASGKVGPNLDQLKPTADVVKAIVSQGRGAMPSFSGQLTPEQIDQVSAYVATSAGP